MGPSRSLSSVQKESNCDVQGCSNKKCDCVCGPVGGAIGTSTPYQALVLHCTTLCTKAGTASTDPRRYVVSWSNILAGTEQFTERTHQLIDVINPI